MSGDRYLGDGEWAKRLRESEEKRLERDMTRLGGRGHSPAARSGIVAVASFEEDEVGGGPVILRGRQQEKDVERDEAHPTMATVRMEELQWQRNVVGRPSVANGLLTKIR